MKYLVILYSLVFLFITSSCKDEDNPELNVLKLDRDEILFENIGGDKTIQLTTNGEWETKNIPNWLLLSKTSGNTSIEIVIKAETNNKYEDRTAEIIFKGEGQTVMLKVIQSKRENVLNWNTFLLNQFSSVNDTLGADNIERAYNFEANGLFVNPSIQDKVFLGNLVNRKMGVNTNLTEYKGYTFNPIVTFSFDDIETFTPSKTEERNVIERIRKEYPNDGQKEASIPNSNGVKFSSYRELNLIGAGNMGINLDEVISGSSYKEKEMTKSNGLVFVYEQTYLSLDMDFPDQLVKEEIKKEDFPNGGLSFISRVSYGRVGLLIIESDHDIKKVGSAAYEMMKGRPITEEENRILNESDIYHLYFDKNHKLHTQKGKTDVIESCHNYIASNTYDIYLTKFVITDYFEHFMVDFTYSVTLP